MVFELEADNLWFPDAELAEPDGLLAIGGDLRPERLKEAYQQGIFPWYSDETPILWYAPHERFVLFPSELRISKSMCKLMRSTTCTITANRDFAAVIRNCAGINRPGQQGTWITKDMREAYEELHNRNWAISVEVWQGAELVGGLYGVSCGQVFCGESMFSKQTNASKMALIWLCSNFDYQLVDCQIYSEHLASMGARMLPREIYMDILVNGTHLLH